MDDFGVLTPDEELKQVKELIKEKTKSSLLVEGPVWEIFEMLLCRAEKRILAQMREGKNLDRSSGQYDLVCQMFEWKEQIAKDIKILGHRKVELTKEIRGGQREGGST